MPEPARTFGTLLVHFFRRFFDNDTIQVEGDTATTVARALAVAAVPGLAVAFFLQNQYPQRGLWGRIEDQYFFILLSFVVLGAITIFEWDMLFPDRADFLVLTPLPLVQGQVMAAKATALMGFLALFLVGSGVPGTLMYSVICQRGFGRQLLAHTLAVGLAGVFVSGALLACGGCLRCLLHDRAFRIAAPWFQALATTALGLLVVQYARYGQFLHFLLVQQSARARWFPPLWFLGLYDQILYGPAAPAFASPLSRFAVWGTGIALLLALVTYPVAWTRTHRTTLEGAAGRDTAPRRVSSDLIHRAVRRSPERAMCHFIGQTLQRGSRYQVYLAMYGGTGLALAIACSCALQAQGHRVTLRLSSYGLHAVFPLLCFWLIAGLRTAFAFPVYLGARWIFRVAGTDSRDLAAAGKLWTLGATMLLLCVTIVLLVAAGCSLRELSVQVVTGACLAVLLTDAFFAVRRVPLIHPRMPGRSNFAFLLTLYLGVLTPALFAIVFVELRMERSPWLLVWLLAATLTIHAIARRFQQWPMEIEEEMEGYEGEFQRLNLG